MALSASERRLIEDLVDRQLQLEAFIASRISPVAGLGVRLSHADPLNSPLILGRDDRLAIAKHGAKTGKRIASKIKRKRKVSPYQKEFGRQFKAVKKAHPRTKVSVLMSRAHKKTKRAMKK